MVNLEPDASLDFTRKGISYEYTLVLQSSSRRPACAYAATDRTRSSAGGGWADGIARAHARQALTITSRQLSFFNQLSRQLSTAATFGANHMQQQTTPISTPPAPMQPLTEQEVQQVAGGPLDSPVLGPVKP
jgi:hypothetical protein